MTRAAKNYQVRGNRTKRFSEIPDARIQRSTFDRSFGVKTTWNDVFNIYPIMVDEVLPGDTMNVSMTGLVRLSTPLHPFMDNLYVDTFFFFVPYRLVWDNWEKFNGQQDAPDDSTDYVIPRVSGEVTVGEHTLFDHMGLPLGLNLGTTRISALPFRAYKLIYNEWFRDQNFTDPFPVATDDGPDDGQVDASYPMLGRRLKRHDYFTSALPWPQKGPAVQLPLGLEAPVEGIGTLVNLDWVTGSGPLVRETGREDEGPRQWPEAYSYVPTGTSSAEDMVIRGTEAGTGGWPYVVANLAEATAASINELRQAFQIQRLLERDARGGTRYTEVIRSHFGVVSPDQRLQRPEYLGGGSSPIQINPVPQTSATDEAVSEQANLAAVGIAIAHNHGFRKSFTEHGIILGMASVRGEYNYQQGIDRMWSRETRFDFYWPALAHLGEQAVLSKEIYADGTAGDDDVWGYQERYAEYRYKPSLITGRMRSNATGSLDTWHLAQFFTERPQLGHSFLLENPALERVLAVPSEDNFIVDLWFKYRCARPMPVYGVPGLIDHF